MYPTDQAPGSHTAVRLADLDHDRPWRDDGTGGPTDAHTLQPIGRPMHVGKTPVHGRPPDWTVTRNPDGTRTWRHRTGLTSTVHRPRRRLDDPT